MVLLSWDKMCIKIVQKNIKSALCSGSLGNVELCFMYDLNLLMNCIF